MVLGILDLFAFYDTKGINKVTKTGAGTRPDAALTLPARAGDLAMQLKSRRSVRKYQARPVPRELIEQVLEAARWAPSPHGRQPWRFVVLTREEPKRLLAEAMGAEWQRTLEMDGEAAEIVAARLVRSRERIQHAPALVLACLYL